MLYTQQEAILNLVGIFGALQAPYFSYKFGQCNLKMLVMKSFQNPKLPSNSVATSLHV